ncbi:hypothetical protein Neosp_000849 [[Neocosmospora] mangrovei]
MSYPRGRSPLERLSPDSLWVLVDFLDYPEVHNLARCSRTLHRNVEFFLYTRESKDEAFQALYYAVDTIQDDVGVQTITKLAHYVRSEDRIAYFNVRYDHENGYSHPLHIAGMRNNIEQVKKLLELGADAEAMCHNLTPLLSRGQLQALRAMGLDKVLEDCEWKANLIPFMSQNRPLCSLLHRCDGSSIVAQSLNESNRAITMFHLAVLQDNFDFMGIITSNNLWPGDVDIQMPKSGQTALHLAIRHETARIFDMLLPRSTLNGIYNEDGANVLHFAIEEVYMTAHAPTRRWFAQIVKRLLDQGADPNEPKSNLTSRTPLLLATEAVRYDWYRVWREVKSIINLLIQKGANVNNTDSNGATPLVTVLNRVISESDHGSMQTMFLDLIQNHGANINFRPPGSKSITFRLIDAPATPAMATLCKKVVALGGTIAQDEVPEVFKKCLPKFTKELLQPDWRYVDAQTGMSFLHAVVDKLARKAEYTEEMAVADVKELTGNQRQVRCLVMYRDPEGKTVLDRVTDMDQQFPLLVDELTKKHAAQAKKPELCRAAWDLEQGWRQVQQNQ